MDSRHAARLKALAKSTAKRAAIAFANKAKKRAEDTIDRALARSREVAFAGIGLVPTEHKQNTVQGVQLTAGAAMRAQALAAKGDCVGAQKELGKSRAYAAVTLTEAFDSGAGSAAKGNAQRAIRTVKRAERDIEAVCEITFKGKKQPQLPEPKPALPAPAQTPPMRNPFSPLNGVRRRRRSRR